MSKKQTTLFQSWGSSRQKTTTSSSSTSSRPRAGGGPNSVIDLCNDGFGDDDDLLLAMAMQESLKEAGKVSDANSLNQPSTSRLQNINNLDAGTGHEADFSEDSNDIYETMALTDIPQATNIEDLPGFDNAAGRLWIYPTNYPVREYQFTIVRQGLFNNCLVVLPTGMGKTFIAAVVMFNYYRWYPQGKVVFMAPTKPLVAQQIEACYNIMGIPRADTAEMTGAMHPPERQRAWQSKRVFFLTPQVLTNDLSRGALPAEGIKCLVIDEAHKALGNHAYCQVVRELVKYNQDFRVLALSATPGSDIKAVQNVLSNLLISHVELRSEDSVDIRPYTHERKVDKIVVPLGQELTAIKETYLQIISVTVNKLKRLGVLYAREPKSLSKFLILKARDGFRQNPPQNMQRSQFGAVEGDFALCMSLYHGYELLQLHGLRSLYNFLESLVTGEKGYGRTKTELMRNATFRALIEELRDKFQPVKAANPNTQQDPMTASQFAKPFQSGHPKMDKLCEVVVEHFNKFEAAGKTTRVMIFSQYRDSVNEITEMLNRHRPLCRVMSFIGQNSSGKASKGFSQKEQLKVMRQFREGGYNTLVSTCVGEEGLDIGDVDLIVCFDAHKSPIRLVQRMGRTGRKREGRIVMLVTEGKEEQVYNQSQFSKNKIHKAILNGAKSLLFYPNNPRMVPQGLEPQCHKMHITVSEKFSDGKGKGKKSKAPTTISAPKPARNKTSTASKDGYLTAEELSYWDARFKVDSVSMPTVRTHSSPMLSIKEKSEEGSFLSLSKWMPWQNRMQDTAVISHSARTKHLVDTIEFMDVQSAVGDEDTYGQEMAMFLNRDDVLKPGQRNGAGILNYCTPLVNRQAERVNRKKARLSDQLPDFSSDDDHDSDTELTALGDILKGKTSKQKTVTDQQEKHPDTDAATSKEFTEIAMRKNKGKKNKKRSTEKSMALISHIDVIAEDNSNDFEGCENTNQATNMDDETLHGKPSTSTANEEIMREKSAPLQDKSNAIERTSSDPFEKKANDESHNIMDTESNTVSENIVSRLISRANSVENMDVDSGNNSHISDVHEDMAVDYEAICDNVDKTPNNKYETSDRTFHSVSEIPVRNDNRYSISPEASGIQNDSSNKSTDQSNKSPGSSAIHLPVSPSTTNSIMVKSPAVPPAPSIEDVHLAFKELDQQGRLSPVNILDLVDEWHRESLNCSHLEVNEKVNDKIRLETKQTQTKKSEINPKAKMSVTTSHVVINDSDAPPKSSEYNRHDAVDNNSRIIETYNSVVDPNTEKSAKRPLFKNRNSSSPPCRDALSENTVIPETVSDSELPFQNYSKEESHKRKQSPNADDSETTPERIHAHTDSKGVFSPSPSRSCKRDFVSAADALEQIQRDSTSSDADSPVFSQTQQRPKQPSINTSTPVISEPITKLSGKDDLGGQDSLDNTFADDSIFEHYKTPISGRAKVSVTQSAKKGQNPNTTQISFTQALACVHESFSASASYSPKDASLTAKSSESLSNESQNQSFSPKPDLGSESSKTKSKQSDVNIQKESSPQAKVSIIPYNKSSVCENNDAIPTENSLIDNHGNHENQSSEDELADSEAQFDLGLDFDEDVDDVDDVIPPSPGSTQPFSQVSRLSVTVDPVKSSISPGLIGGLGAKFNPSQSSMVDKSSSISEANVETRGINRSASSKNSNISDEGKASKKKPETSNDTFFGDEDDGIFCEILDNPAAVGGNILHESNSSEESQPLIDPFSIDSKNKQSYKSKTDKQNNHEKTSAFALLRSPPLSQSHRHKYNHSSTPVARVAPQAKVKATKKDTTRSNRTDTLVTNTTEPSVTQHALADIETMEISAVDFEESMFEANTEQQDIPNTENIATSMGFEDPLGVTDNSGNDIDKNKEITPGSVKSVPAYPRLLDDDDEVNLTQNKRASNMKGEEPLNSVSTVQALMADMETMDISVQDFQDAMPGEAEVSEVEKNGHSEGSDEESIIHVRRRKALLITSPESPHLPRTEITCADDSDFKTPIKPAPQNKKRPLVQSESEFEESPVVKLKKRKSALEILDDTLEKTEEEDFEESFELPKKKVSNRVEERKENRKQAKVHRPRGNRFLEEEAEVSGSDSGDESDRDADHYDMSFVDDATQLSQGLPERDMRAVYLQSVRSPELRGAFKLRYNHNQHLDVFSQAPRGDEEGDSYEEDSFCVGSEFNESEYIDDPTFIEPSKILPRERKRKTRNSNKTILQAEAASRANRPSRDSRRRVQRHSSSSSDGEERLFTQRPRTSSGSPKPKPRISSTESTSPSFEHSPPQQTRDTAPANAPRNRPHMNKTTTKHKPYQPSSSLFSVNKRLSNQNPVSVISTCHNSSKRTASKTSLDSHSPFHGGLTQMPSLRSRCQMRLDKNVKNDKTDHGQFVSNNTMGNVDFEKVENIQNSDANFDLSFDLGVDFDDDNLDENIENNTNLAITSKENNKNPLETRNLSNETVFKSPNVITNKAVPPRKTKPNTSGNISGVTTNSFMTPNSSTSRTHNTVSTVQSSSGYSPNKSTESSGYSPNKSAVNTSTITTREERLRLSRLKQEEFRKKLAEKKSVGESGHGSDILNASLSIGDRSSRTHGAYSSPMPSTSFMSSVASTSSGKQTPKLTIIVDSREINGAQDCISVLRAKHHCHTVVAQLQACDYIVSNRMAVERKLVGDFTNGAQRAKLIERVRDMSELYEKLVLIVERERLRPGEKDLRRPLLRSKYVEVLMAALSQMQVKVYFSESQENTADVLVQLADVEKRKDNAVTSRTALTPSQNERLRFYLSLPRVSYVTALNFVLGYPTVKDLIRSPATILQKRGCISKSKADNIYRYLRHSFDPQMVGIR